MKRTLLSIWASGLLLICVLGAGPSSWFFVSGGAWSPLQLNNEFFFRADSVTGSGVVDTWDDLSSNNRDAAKVAGTSWTLTATTAAINNQPSAQGNNSAYYRYLPDSTNLLTDANTPFYVYGVVQTPSSYATNFRWFLCAGWYSTGSLILASADSANYSKFYGGRGNNSGLNGVRNTTFNPSTSVWFTFILAYNGGGDPVTPGNWTMYMNGTSYTPAATSAAIGIGGVSNFLGAAPNGGQLSTLGHAEVGLVKATFDNTVRDNLFAYWLSRYGL